MSDAYREPDHKAEIAALEDQVARLQRRLCEHRYARRQKLIGYVYALLAVGAHGAFWFYFLSPNAAKWATGLVSAVMFAYAASSRLLSEQKK